MPHHGEMKREAKELARKLLEIRPPKLGVLAGDRVIYSGLAVPTDEELGAHSAWFGRKGEGLEGWALELLEKLERKWGGKGEVLEFYGVWAGNPPRVFSLVKLPMEEGQGNP